MQRSLGHVGDGSAGQRSPDLSHQSTNMDGRIGWADGRAVEGQEWMAVGADWCQKSKGGVQGTYSVGQHAGTCRWETLVPKPIIDYHQLVLINNPLSFASQRIVYNAIGWKRVLVTQLTTIMISWPSLTFPLKWGPLSYGWRNNAKSTLVTRDQTSYLCSQGASRESRSCLSPHSLESCLQTHQTCHRTLS